ncbi:hypothetical protein [Streptomyces sp. NPDC001315]|uniref:hypothetical protein n=1 Tax=Streptomyces sp. NPDC001315 TaxID=3364562 RepID=UPI0036A064D8
MEIGHVASIALMPSLWSTPVVQAVLTGLVAVLGTIVGSVVTYIFQRKTAERSERFARDEWLLQQRMDTYSAFSEVLMDFRGAQYNRWYRLRDDPNGEDGAVLAEQTEPFSTSRPGWRSARVASGACLPRWTTR